MSAKPTTLTHTLISKLKSPPTAMTIQNSEITIAQKSGEIVTVSSEAKERKVLVKDKNTTTAICAVDGILLVGARTGEIKSLCDKKYKRISKRHRGQIISIHAIKTENNETEIITTSADHRVFLWKLDINESKGSKTVHLLFMKALYGPNTPIKSTSMSPDKKLLLCTAELTETVRIFKLEKDTQLLFNLKDGHALYGAFVTNEQFIVMSNRSTLHLYNINKTDPVKSLHIPTEDEASAEVSSLKLISPGTAAIGFSNGQIIIVSIAETAEILSYCQIDGIPNDFMQKESTLYVAAGKEESHSRFFVNKSFLNGFVAIPM
ncbi:hypothetical protein NEPAR06_1389 [Nematocida parisii]|nr:hypothetical protein NEPAR07_0616 [Nematocida parisii]KAI5154923.1 hypothetical protein NEPAR06_1389 [Nematocida parisii]KAI5156320.1 hypothetical protein NEPAR05_0481 [Nematocida parisii]